MLRGCWLSLLPATENKLNNFNQEQTPSENYQPISNQPRSTTAIHITPRSRTTIPHQLHHHDHHPHLNAILKPIILDSPSSRKNKSSHHPPPHSFPILPLQENSDSSQFNSKSSFEIRSLQVCDIDQVKELHSSTLPVTYPSSFFYNLLSSNPDGIISLVATLPSAGAQSYFDTFHSHHHHHHHPCRSTFPALASTHHGHHHHITSPLSGRKPISLDVVGCITARFLPPDNNHEKEHKSVRILTLCVNPDYRRSGVGKMLLTELTKKIKLNSLEINKGSTPNQPGTLVTKNDDTFGKIKINLHVQATNLVAFNFYKKNGFKIVCFKSNYYSNNDLKPLNPELKSIIKNDKKNEDDQFTHSKLNQLDPKDIDAWLLELIINF